MKKINILMLLKWLVFLPVLLLSSMLGGAVDGLWLMFERAIDDIYRPSN